MNRESLTLTCVLTALFFASTAGAEEASRAPLTWHAAPLGGGVAASPSSTSRPDRPVSDAHGAAEAVEDGELLPFTLGAGTPRNRAGVVALGGYDSASGQARARSSAEVRTFDWLMFRVDYDHGPATGNPDRVSFGARFALLNQRRHGLDFGAGLAFQPKDFRGEGDFVGALAVSRSFGRLSLSVNALFGTDSEGDDQSLEARMSALLRLGTHFHLGLDGHGRTNLSEDEKRFDAERVQWELEGGPLFVASLGPVALLATVGPTALDFAAAGEADARVSVGALAMAGAGAAF